MAFVWSRTITAGTTTISKTDMDEIKNNINAIHGKLFGTNANFGTKIHDVNTPVGKNEELQNYRQVLDSIHTKNVCSHYTAYNSVVHST